MLWTTLFATLVGLGFGYYLDRTITKTFERFDGTQHKVDVELFTWEKLDYVDKVRAAFDL